MELIKDCNDMNRCYRWPYPLWIDACKKHMKKCSKCSEKYSNYYENLDKDLDNAVRAVNNARNSFIKQSKSKNFGVSLGVNSIDQIAEEFINYHNKDPNNNLYALIWIQKVFTVCRFFEAEDTFRSQMLPNEKKWVGNMKTPEGKKFSDISKLSDLIFNPHNTFEYNRKLETVVEELFKSKQDYKILCMVCESPKHGVLSSILNFVATVHAKQIYSIGLYALTQAINAFIEKYYIENNKDSN